MHMFKAVSIIVSTIVASATTISAILSAVYAPWIDIFLLSQILLRCVFALLAVVLILLDTRMIIAGTDDVNVGLAIHAVQAIALYAIGDGHMEGGLVAMVFLVHVPAVLSILCAVGDMWFLWESVRNRQMDGLDPMFKQTPLITRPLSVLEKRKPHSQYDIVAYY